MSRLYPQRPIVGVGVVVLRGAEVLLIRRGKPPKPGSWSLPGGAQELGETVFDTGRREVREETGIELHAIEHLTVVDMIERDERGDVRYHYTLVDLVAIAETASRPRSGGDAAEARWWRLVEAMEMPLWSETKRIISMAREHPLYRDGP